ncbi:NUP98 family protein [Megaselia abdita]
MFSKNFNQPGSTFGSGFGQTQQNTSTFGNTSSFGNPPTFGTASQSNNIFGSSTTAAPAFGGFQAQTQPTTGVFGQQATQAGAFGATQPFKSSFNFSAASQPQQTATQQNLFSSNAGTANRGFSGSFTPSTNTFGSTSFGATPGTTDQNVGSSIAKYQPTNSTDTLVKNNQQNSISTRQHCITAMKEYENKSLEEIRFEDYSANRKGVVMGANTSIFSSPQQQQQPTSQMNLFGTQQQTQPQQANIFGAPQQENKNPFGQSAFGQPNTFGLNTSTTDFTKPFGSTTNTFASTDNNNSIFGSKPAFGAIPTSNPSVFGTQTSSANTLFGTTNNAFAAPAQPLSTAPTSSAFQVVTNTSGFGSFASGINSNANTNLFGAKPNTTTLTNFNANPGFGVSTQNAFPTFNANTTTSSSLFNTQTTKANTTFTGFTGLNTTLNNPPANQSFFSSNVNKPIGLGTTSLGKPANSMFSNLGQPALTNLKTNMGQQSLVPQSSSSKTLIHQQLLSKVSSPFGENPLFKDIKLKQNEDKTAQKLLPSKNPTDSLFKVNTKSDSKQTFVRNVLSKKSLFEGLEEYDNSLDQCFNIKSNNRRLLIAPKAVTPTLDSSANKISKTIVIAEEQENENVNVNKRDAVESKQDSWLCSEKIKEGGKYKEVSFENTMNELVPNKESEKELPETGLFEENVNESKVLLTRPGYFTIPSVNELNTYVRNGQCIIPNFTIGRTGYGNIYFNEEIDVFGLNLDLLVHFRHKEVTVYPDEGNKPPIGQGLNREAQITLDQVWPNDKTTQNYIKDIDQLNHLDFEGKLRRICGKKGVRFIEYRPETGSWVFKVKHFSKYGYNDSDDEDDVVPKEGVQHRQAALLVPNKEVKVIEPIVREISTLEKSNKGDENENSMFYGSITTTMGKINKTNTRKLQLMKATYFVDDHMSDNEEMVDISNDITGLLDITSSKPVKRSVVQQLTHERPSNFIPEVSCNLRFDYKLSPLLSKCCLSDVALLNMNRFKSTFGRNTMFIVRSPPNRVSHIPNPRKTYNNSLSLVTINCESEIPHRLALEFLKINFHNSERFEQEDSECPVYKKQLNYSIVQDYLKVVNSNGNTKFELHSFLKSVWSLCFVLWNDLQNEKQWCTNEQMVRRNFFTKWLEDNCNDESALTYTDELLNLVSKHKISDACELAMKNSDITMALLLSQASNRKNFRDIVEDQLSSWNTSGVDKYITENRLKLIMMIAGVPIMDSHCGTISLFENKNWLQILSIQHWYINMPTCSIERTVHSFESLLKNNAINKRCLRPEFYKPNSISDNVFDARYHILNLFSDASYSLEKVINNICNTPHDMDYFTSWMLLDLFKMLGYKHCSLISERKVQENVALQLESAGYWEWSIYILLHIDSKLERETSIQNILTRNINLKSKESLEKQKFVVDDLGIPRHWIDIAKYYKSRRMNNPWFEFKFLLKANKNIIALQTFYSHMAPHAIINGNFLKISVLLQYFDKLFSNKSEGYSYWEITGQALFHFVNLLRTSKKYILELEDPRQLNASIMNVKRDFEVIISKIKRMPTNSIYDVLCQTEICQNLHLLLNNLYSGSSQKNKVYYEMLIILEGLIPYDLLKI